MAITGNIHFYGKSGFLVAKSCGIWYAEDAEGKCFLIAEQEAGFLKGMSGTYRDPTGCFVDEGGGRVDAAFPPKEKLKLPGQCF